MGACCCCCDDDEQQYQQTSGRNNHNRRNNSRQGYGGAGNYTPPPTNASRPTPPPRPPAPPPPSNQCQFCGHTFDPSLLDGHKETCRINLRKKASEMRSNDGQVVSLRVFECDPNVEYEDDQVCVVCMANLRSYAIVPCGHLIACGLCAKQLEKCPMCRKDRQGLLFVDPMTELKTTCKSCKNVIHPAYFDGHREVCALHMRLLAKQIEEEEAEMRTAQGEGNRREGEGEGNREHSTPPSPALEAGTTKPHYENEYSDPANSENTFAIDPTADTKPLLAEGVGAEAANRHAILNASSPLCPPSAKPEGEKENHAADNKNTSEVGEKNQSNNTSQNNSRGVSPSRSPRILANHNSPALGTSPSGGAGLGGAPKATCIECRRQPIEVAFIPCGHSCVCGACGSKLGLCPICLQEVKSTMQTFK